MRISRSHEDNRTYRNSHHRDNLLAFPKNFEWGAATAPHQVEGNNMNSDWWMYEKQGRLPSSGNTADHYNRFEEDFAIAKSIGLNGIR